MDAETTARELRRVKKELTACARRSEWRELNGALEWVVGWGEQQGGNSALAARARAVQELLGPRGSGRDRAGARVEELLTELGFELDGEAWTRSSHPSH